MSRFACVESYKMIEIYERLVRFMKSGDMERWCYHEFGKGIEMYRIQEEIIDFSLDIMKGSESVYENISYFTHLLEKIEEWSNNLNSAICIPITE
jgi:Zn/Cd-binding protein ZinT